MLRLFLSEGDWGVESGGDMIIRLLVFLVIPSMLLARNIRLNDNYYLCEWDGEVELSLLADRAGVTYYRVTAEGVEFSIIIGKAPDVSITNGSARFEARYSSPYMIASYETNGVLVVSITRVYARNVNRSTNLGNEEYCYEYITAEYLTESDTASSNEESVIYFLRHIVRGKCEQGEE